MTKKTTNKKANMANEENIKDAALDAEMTENVENTSLDTEKDEDTENTILDVENKDSDIINEALEGNTSDTNNEDGQKPTTTSEEKEVEQPKSTEDNVGNKDSHDIKQNSNDKVNTAKHNISKLFGYYWNGQLMD